MNTPYRYTAYPDDTYRPYKRKKHQKEELWCAPEHFRHAKHMEKAYDLDHDGNKILENGRRLVLDPRPEIMQPKREPIFLGLS